MNISVEKLNQHLFGNFDNIILILKELGMPDINPNYSKREIRCSREEGRNPSSVLINIDTLYYKCFSTGDKGSIYTLIMGKLDKCFREALQWTAKVLGVAEVDLKSQAIKLPFGGFFKDIIKQVKEPELNMPKYNLEILDTFTDKYSLMFCKDGIGYTTQKYFSVGYDAYSNRTTIPQWDVNGNLVGIMGRLNETEAPKEERWLPIVSCHRSLTVFGYHYNYKYIQQKGFCLIGESEKFVMQLHSMGIKNALATCGCDISAAQARYIKALMCEKIILCYDEGLEEDRIIEQAKKLKIDTPIYKNDVGYIYDGKGELLPIGSKSSPSDLGVDILKELIRTKVKWL